MKTSMNKNELKAIVGGITPTEQDCAILENFAVDLLVSRAQQEGITTLGGLLDYYSNDAVGQQVFAAAVAGLEQAGLTAGLITTPQSGFAVFGQCNLVDEINMAIKA